MSLCTAAGLIRRDLLQRTPDRRCVHRALSSPPLPGVRRREEEELAGWGRESTRLSLSLHHTDLQSQLYIQSKQLRAIPIVRCSRPIVLRVDARRELHRLLLSTRSRGSDLEFSSSSRSTSHLPRPYTPHVQRNMPPASLTKQTLKRKRTSEAGAANEDGDAVTSSSAAAATKPYKQRVLVTCSRGISQRQRHLMMDLLSLLPHAKKGQSAAALAQPSPPPPGD